MASYLKQLHPLELNTQTGEPFLRLPEPFANIILTPPRMSDVAFVVENLNDPLVYTTLMGPPFPYLEEHAVSWLNMVAGPCDALLAELKEFAEAHPESAPKIVGGCPVRILREVQPDGTELFLGDLGVDRCGFPGVLDTAERARLSKENDARDVGDEDIVWCLGDYIRSSHHGRGIMTVAMRTLIREWMIPRMNAKLIRSEVYKGNRGSVRVFEKNGFVLTDTVDRETVTTAGVPQHGEHILWWRL